MIYEFFTSRNNSANAASFVGQAGRLFYDGTNGVIKLSDGATPGGTFIPYNIATTTTIGGIKAGPGANVSTDGTLTINTAGLPLGIGNLDVTDNILSSVNNNADVVVQSNGTGNVELVGNVAFYSTAQGHTGTPYFRALGDGQISILVPAADTQAGAVKIIGSSTGGVIPPENTGVLLQLTGNTNDPSRLYNDAVNNFSAYVGRRLNGTLASPTALRAGDEIIRISATGHDGNSVPSSGSGRFLFQAVENFTTSARGTNISVWTTAIGSTTLAKTATFDSANGLTVTKATVQGNLTVANVAPATNNIYNLGSPTQRWKSTYVGVQGMYIRDTNDTVDAQLTVSNGVLYINGIQGLTAGNLYFQDNSILSLLPSQDIVIGNVFPASGNIVLNRITNFISDVHSQGNFITSGGTTINNGITTANITINAGGTLTTPRVVINDGGIRSIQDGIYANLSFATDSIVHAYQPSGDLTVNLSGYTAGATIRLIVGFGPVHAINLGVSAAKSTNGSTTLAAARISNNQAVQIIYTCVDGTSANCYAALSYT